MEQQIPLASLYELNKVAVGSQPPLTQIEIWNKFGELKKSLFYDADYGLLCREKYDFTVFRITDNVAGAVTELEGVLNSRGQILAIDTDTDDTYEFWIRTDDGEINMYKFFQCDWVIDC